jgi:hypothetical protein
MAWCSVKKEHRDNFAFTFYLLDGGSVHIKVSTITKQHGKHRKMQYLGFEPVVPVFAWLPVELQYIFLK